MKAAWRWASGLAAAGFMVAPMPAWGGQAMPAKDLIAKGKYVITGIGRWTEEQIARSITTGERPNAAPVGSLMRVVIQGTSVGYKDMTPADALAIARYLKTVPAIDNTVR